MVPTPAGRFDHSLSDFRAHIYRTLSTFQLASYEICCSPSSSCCTQLLPQVLLPLVLLRSALHGRKRMNTRTVTGKLRPLDLSGRHDITDPELANSQTSSYGHNSYGLKDVTMDDSSNSVYLTIGTGLNEEQMRLFAFDGKSGNGGYCTGHQLGEITASGFCVDLNTFYPGSRIRCVRFQRA